MWWPIGVCAIEDGDEVGFEGLCCSFCWVSLMHACVDQLAVKVLGPNAGCEFIGNFIVKSVEDWFDSCICEALVACITSLDQVVRPSALDGFSWCGIGIMVAQCGDVTVSLDALPRKGSWWVCAHETLQFFQFECIGCDLVLSVDSGSWWVKWFLLSEEWFRWCSGGSQALSDLFDSSHWSWN